MKNPTPSSQRRRFPSGIIRYAVWPYHRFCLSFREVEELLSERGITVIYETVRQWCQKFGPAYARKFKNRQGRLGDIWHLDEVFVTIQRERHYLWRGVDQDGNVIDILVQPRRNQRTAERFFRRHIKGQGGEPRWLVTDKLRSYDAAHRTIMPTVHHLNHIYAKNRAEVPHEPTRQQERAMRGFRSSEHAQRFLTLHGLTQNLFRLGRHWLQAGNYRLLRAQAFQVWQNVVCAWGVTPRICKVVPFRPHAVKLMVWTLLLSRDGGILAGTALHQQEGLMHTITTIGLDWAKRVFQVHGRDHDGKTVLRKQVRRGQVLKLFATLPPCLVGMEACGSAHPWARELQAQGHEVRLIPPQ